MLMSRTISILFKLKASQLIRQCEGTIKSGNPNLVTQINQEKRLQKYKITTATVTEVSRAAVP